MGWSLVVVGWGSLHVFCTLVLWSSESLVEFRVMRKPGLLRLLHRQIVLARHRGSRIEGLLGVELKE